MGRASVMLWTLLQQKPFLTARFPTSTYTHGTHRIEENCKPLLSVVSHGRRTIHSKLWCHRLLSKTISFAARLQSTCLLPCSYPSLVCKTHFLVTESSSQPRIVYVSATPKICIVYYGYCTVQKESLSKVLYFFSVFTLVY